MTVPIWLMGPTVVTNVVAAAPIAVGATVDGGSGGSQTNGTLTANLPACSVGDLLLMCFDTGSNDGTLSSPTGWTQVAVLDGGASLYWHTLVCAKVAESGDNSGTAEVNLSGYSDGHSYVVTAIENADTTSLTYDNATLLDAAYTTSVTYPALTSSNDDLVIRCGSHDNSALTPPTGCTSQGTNLSQNGVSICTDDDQSLQQTVGTTALGGPSLCFTIAIPEAA